MSVVLNAHVDDEQFGMLEVKGDRSVSKAAYFGGGGSPLQTHYESQ